jgi:hypothetical protein
MASSVDITVNNGIATVEIDVTRGLAGAAADLSSPDPIGDVTPNSGAFTTLSATGTATLPHIHGSLAGNLYIHVRNTTGGVLSRGTPIYIVGNVGDTDRVTVAAADNTNAAKMPAVGLLEESLNHNGDGNAIIVGELPAANTNSYSINQELYVGVGAITGTKPTTGEVQSVGVVARVNTNTGVIVVNMQGRRTRDGAFATAAQGALADSAVQPGDLATVATTGAYADLSGTPTLGNSAALNVGTTAGTVAAGDDARLSDERVPTAAGLTTKFGTAKATPVDADKVAILDSAASDAPKHSTLTAIWTWIQSKFAGASSKTTPIDADSFNIVDSADSNAAKRVTGTNLKAYLKTYLDTLYVALTGNQTVAGNKTFSGSTVMTGGLSATTESISVGTGTAARFFANGSTAANVWIKFTDGNMYMDSDGTFNVRVNGATSLVTPFFVTTAGVNAASGYPFLKPWGSTIADAMIMQFQTGATYKMGLALGADAREARLFSKSSDGIVTFYQNEAEKMRVHTNGFVGIATSTPTTTLDINSNKFRVRTAKTPSSASDTGDAGDICWDASYIYVCTATNTWKRTAIATW